MKTGLIVIVSAMFILLHSAPAHAQAMHTWVSGVGDDVDPCSRTAPCKTFAGAISKTAAGGEISLFDAGGYGVVTITKSISIVAVGFEASVTAPASSINIKAGANDNVSLDGLVIQGNNTGTAAINIMSGGRVDIRNCRITGFLGNPGAAIIVDPNAASQVYVSNCNLFSNNIGIQSDGSTTVYVDGSRIVGNTTGLIPLNKGQIISFGNNALGGNTTDGTPTSTVPLK